MILSDTQPRFDDVEIRLFKEGTKYVASIRSDAGQATCKLPQLPQLKPLSSMADPSEYGSRLYDWLVRDEIKTVYLQSRWSVERYGSTAGPLSGVRLKLWLDPDAQKLHGLWWEALYDPKRQEPVSVGTSFSRFMRTSGAREWAVSERPLRILFAVSSPDPARSNSEGAAEAEIEATWSRPGDGGVAFEKLTGPTTLESLRRARESPRHVVHLFARGTRRGGQTYLELSTEDGVPTSVPTSDVVEALTTGPSAPPFLVFLATPFELDEDGSEKSGEALVRLAPSLVDAGVQAVVAIQGAIGPASLRKFTDLFYNVLARTGIIDLAVAQARAAIYTGEQSWDWASPALYMQTPSAQLFEPLSSSLSALVTRVASLPFS